VRRRTAFKVNFQRRQAGKDLQQLALHTCLCLSAVDLLATKECSIVALPCLLQAPPAPLKPALKRSSSEGRASLHVQWASDVYDPAPSMASHTKGRVKQTLTRRSGVPTMARQATARGKKHGKDNKARKAERPAATSSHCTCVHL